MEILKIRIDSKEDLSFLRKLLDKLNFVVDVEVIKSSHHESNIESEEMPIQWAKSTPSIHDFSGIWKDRNITIEQLREKAWTRS